MRGLTRQICTLLRGIRSQLFCEIIYISFFCPGCRVKHRTEELTDATKRECRLSRSDPAYSPGTSLASKSIFFPIHLPDAPPPSELDPPNHPSHGTLIPQIFPNSPDRRNHPQLSETRHARRQPRSLGVHPRRFLHQPRGILHQSRRFEAGFLRGAGRLLDGGGGAGCGC